LAVGKGKKRKKQWQLAKCSLQGKKRKDGKAVAVGKV
jgi:hypothetical protein